MTLALFIPPPWFFIILVTFGVVLGTVAYLILLERKVASWTQDRVGPNRVGPFGLFQPLADGLKMFFKEDYAPSGVDKLLFSVAPAIIMSVVLISIAVIPWGGTLRRTTTLTLPGDTDITAAANAAVPLGSHIIDQRIEQQNSGTTLVHVTYEYPFQIADLDIGVLFVIAVLSLAVYGIVVGGWASNNKYSFLGALRATAQMISYEIPLGLAILTIVVMYGTLNLGDIVEKQSHYWAGWVPAWNVVAQPLGFIMFLICIHAEANRAPFDLAEAEQELVGGYHTEYSSMRLGLLLLGEYAGMIVTSSVCVALFFGGWHLPWLDKLWPALSGNVDPANASITTSLVVCLIRSAVFFTKTLVIIFVFMWVRWSLPRFRFDQLMMLTWRAMIPMSLLLLMATAIAIYVLGDQSHRAYMRLGGRLALALLGVNVAVVLASMLASRILPAPPPTNRRLRVEGSRFEKTPLPLA